MSGIEGSKIDRTPAKSRDTRPMDYEIADLNNNSYSEHLFERELGLGPRWAIGLGALLAKVGRNENRKKHEQLP